MNTVKIEIGNIKIQEYTYLGEETAVKNSWEIVMKNIFKDTGFVIGYIEYDEDEKWCELRSVGTRLLEYMTPTIQEIILYTCDLIKKIKSLDEIG